MEHLSDAQHILNVFRGIVESWDEPIIGFEKGRQSLKMTVYFKDGSKLKVHESLLLLKKSFKYNYYWFKDDYTLIIGWDNAPHNHKVETMPYHKHVGDSENVEPSEPMTLRKVLAYIADKIGL